MIIIANPPYEFGNAITTTVLNNVDFDDYVNLMPTSEYENKNVSKHIIRSEFLSHDRVRKAFGIQHPCLEIAILSKQEVNNYSRVDRVAMRDLWLWEWYKKNLSRTTTAEVFSGIFKGKKSLTSYNEDYFNRSIIFNQRFVRDGNHKENGDAWDLDWNYKLSSYKEFCDKIQKKGKGTPDAHALVFKTPEEKKNFVKWQRTGKLYEIILTKMISTGTIYAIRDIMLPHINWSKEWTDEEILKDYGYTDEEIKELLLKPQIS